MSRRTSGQRDDVIGGPVLAAGAICWRPSAAGLELLLVRSARWGEWSWPKGKLDLGETLPECAVREVAEETGVRIELGVPLPSVSYVLPDQRAKTVRYWAGRVIVDTGLPTASDEEISDVEWLPAELALQRLTRPGDLPPARELLALAESDRLDTRPLLVVRHAKARSRAHWSGSEADRPLTSAGRRQARDLARLLGCWQPDRLLCSPWARCMQTFRPYLDHPEPLREAILEPEVLPLLSEQGLHNDSDRIRSMIAELVNDGVSTLLCTHRPVLEVVIEVLADFTDDQVRKRLPEADPWLAPAEVLVAHVSPAKGAQRQVQALEQYRGRSHRHS